MWQTRPDDGEYGERLAAAGLRAAAYAPIHGPTSLIGLLVMGTSSAAAAERIGDQLPTLLSFAAIAGALIGSAQERHNQDAAARVELSTIIDEGRFAPVFQPVVELASSRVVGYEALTRFDDGRSPAERFARGGDARVGHRTRTRVSAALPCGRARACSRGMGRSQRLARAPREQ
jgi:hypothetical protein